MKKDDEIKLNAISNIDKELIDKVTEQRIKYAAARNGATGILSGKFYAMAASILLILSTLLTLILLLTGKTPPPVDTRQIPIYKGMTVSAELPSKNGDTAALMSYRLLAADSFANQSAELGNGISPEKEIYYAKPNDDIYITVHLDNPDAFEILSFTLNGEKYTSYMFEDGSDLENIILKINVGNATGLMSYTIDAIKYVDDDKIKDAKMQGDKTVNVGVYNEIQPTAKISDVSCDIDSVSFKTAVTDTQELIYATNGKVYAILYKDGNAIAKKELSVGEENVVTFENLVEGKYQYSIEAIFDAYDGKGYASHVLESGSFSNEIKLDVSFKDIIVSVPTDKAISFALKEYSELIKIEAIEIVRKSDGAILADSNDLNSRLISIDAGAFGTAYIKVKGSYTVNEETRSCEFNSEDFSIPHTPLTDGKIGRLFDSFHPFYDAVTEDWRVHQGIDFFPSSDDFNVYSCTDGTVINIQNSTSLYGTVIEISDITGYIYIYKLLDSASVSIGDSVNTGDVIGKIGSLTSGIEGGDGVHLHLEVMDLSGQLTNPKILPSCEEILNHEMEINSLVRTKKYYGRDNAYIPINATGKIYKEVKFEYSCEYDNASCTDSSITFDLSGISEGTIQVTIRITATLNGVSKTVEHTLEIEKY